MKDTHKRYQKLSEKKRIAPDSTLFTRGGDIEIPGEWKSKPGDDPFVSASKSDTSDVGSRVKPNAFKSPSVFGQIISYAKLAFIKRPRTRVFSFLIVKDLARLLLWDRSGVAVTAAFKWRKNDIFARFFWRYRHMSQAARGHDETINYDDVTAAEDEAAREAMKELIQLRLMTNDERMNTRLCSIVVTDGKTGEQHRLIAAEPVTFPHGVEGSGTVGYYTVDVLARKRKVLYVKDTWRNQAPEFIPEGEIYELLQANKIKYIPKFCYAGDVEGRYQRTVVNEFAISRKGFPFFGRQHYRLVLETIGRPLMTFKNTFFLTIVVADALTG
jgi:hypothetical protein